MVYSPPRLTLVRYLPCDVLTQIVSISISNRYACHTLVVILFIIGMVIFPNPLSRLCIIEITQYYIVEREKSFKHIDYDKGDTYKKIRIDQGKFPYALVIDTQLNSLSQETQVCINVLQVEYIYH